ncbi:helix-turn-helix domain-containing protein [Petroclostridium sp. X23]|uniref:AlbA family DNA-binding domain-containing protein n=1 Tax=Petroclostridium sp. X23 TaxID=3045146 RepID=UPI0024ADF8C0|nr:helix-turn-helix domain-containing protein [Petroclostridium sp. X23]WHH60673.1 helix-turn-helix domain-containing protein [Petroclostridium sp. X23]
MTNTNLEIIIQEGESYKVEFKESIDKTLVEEVCAFANASGGRLFIGISDNGKITGTDTSNVARSRIQDTIRQIQPDLAIGLEVLENIIILTIREGKEKPYSCSKGFYLRVGPNSQKLSRNEIIAFVQSEGRIRFDELVKNEANVAELLDKNKFERYLKFSSISNVLPQEDILLNLGCCIQEEGKAKFTNAGLLFFTNDPMRYIPQAQVVCALYKGAKKVNVLDRKDLTGDLVTIIDEAVVFLKKHLNLRYEIKEIRRKEILELPEIALREAVVNAVCHRDYFEKGASIMIEIFDDRVEISNPGSLPHGMAIEDFGKRSMTRNPTIASLLHRINYIEKMGTGINRMKEACKEVGVAEPVFEITGFFTIIFYRNHIENDKNFGDFGENFGDFGVHINETQIKILKLIQADSKISAKRIAENLNMTTRAIEQSLKDLREKNLIQRIGSARGGSWMIDIAIQNKLK